LRLKLKLKLRQSASQIVDVATSRPARRAWWAVAGLAAIALLALALYTWSLSRNGMANSYYAAAVKSASVSWKAFLFGSLDPGSFITIDKPPMAVWVMALSARVFGFSSWSMLLPQALAGVASVLVLYRLVRRWRGETAGLVAALAFALTPVAVLIFRYNNPDALLTLLLLLAAWAVWSALETGSTLRLALGGVALGSAFLTKMLMAFMVLPALVLAYGLFGPPRLGRRLLQLLVAAVALLVSAGWWVALVSLWPDGARPHVGGTTADSWLSLIFSRSAGVLDGAAMGANLSGPPGWLRVFNEQLGGQVSWLLPLASVGLVAGLVMACRAPRTDRRRAGYVLWGLWVVAMIAVFDSAGGTLHSYYTVVLAPGVAALAGAGVADLGRLGRRDTRWAWVLPAALAATGAWAAVLLAREEAYGLALPLVVAAVTVAGAGLLLVALLRPAPKRMARPMVWVGAFLALVGAIAGPFAYDVSTLGRSVNGSTAAAGPAGSGPYAQTEDSSALEVDAGLVAFLQRNQGAAEYLVAVQATARSVPLILATGEPVVTIGGYKSRDPYPDCMELQRLVSSGALRYVYLTSTKAASASSRGGEGSAADTLQETIDWIVAEGTVIDAAEYGGSDAGTLYYLP